MAGGINRGKLIDLLKEFGIEHRVADEISRKAATEGLIENDVRFKAFKAIEKLFTPEDGSMRVSRSVGTRSPLPQPVKEEPKRPPPDIRDLPPDVKAKKDVLEMLLFYFEKDNFFKFFSETKWAGDTETFLWPLFEKARTEFDVNAALDLMQHCFPGIGMDLWICAQRKTAGEKIQTKIGTVHPQIFGHANLLLNNEAPAHLIIAQFLHIALFLDHKPETKKYLTGEKDWPEIKGPPFYHASVISSHVATPKPEPWLI